MAFGSLSASGVIWIEPTLERALVTPRRHVLLLLGEALPHVHEVRDQVRAALVTG